MKVAVITSYCNEENRIIERAHQSVLAQTVPCEHIIVVDGGIFQANVREAQIVHLSQNHNNYGDTPKWIGAISALAQGFDAVAFLDADDWLSPAHIENCLKALHTPHDPSLQICITNRQLHRPDGSVMNVNEGRDIYQNHCVVMLADAARQLLPLAVKPQSMCEVGDRIMWAVIKQKKIPVIFEPNQTYHYTTLWKVHYDALNEVPPANAKKLCGDGYKLWCEITPQKERDYWSQLIFGCDNFFESSLK
jgi:hypothetical protein